jgi:hypothetical protein
MTLTNRLLRRLNEVQITQSDFPSVRGVQAMAKDVINTAIQEITYAENKWPFNAATTTQVLTINDNSYTWPVDLTIVEWDSFLINPSEALSINGHPLEFVSRDWYIKYRKSEDDGATAAGISVPYSVYENHGNGFGVTPTPDKAYTVTYDYWVGHTDLVDYDDTSTIPSNYDEAIIQSALYHFYMFRDNSEQADRAEVKYKRLLQSMRTTLINKEDRITSGLLPRRNRLAQYVAKID